VIGVPSCFKVWILELNNDEIRAHCCGQPRVVCIEDFRPIARERVPKSVLRFTSMAAPKVRSQLRENWTGYLVMSRFDQSCGLQSQTAILGMCTREFWASTFTLPFPACGLSAYSRLMHPGAGEVAAARAAGRAGTGYISVDDLRAQLENVRRLLCPRARPVLINSI